MLIRVSSWDIQQTSVEQELASHDVQIIPGSARRRLNNYGRRAVLLAADKIEESPLIVFASRYGDVERSLRILEEICQNEALSPMNFSLSVHNAVPGVLSIAWKLKEMQSVISAGINTFAMGLTEAFSLLKSFPNKPVLMIYVDFPLPSIFSDFGDMEEMNGICAVLMHNDGPAKEGLLVRAEFETGRKIRLSERGNPLHVLSSILTGTTKTADIGTDTLNWALEIQDA